MYQPKHGDRVRVVLEGEVGTVDDAGYSLNPESGVGNWISPAEDHVISVEKLEDPEPPVGTILKGLYGEVWTRFTEDQEDGWWLAGDEADFHWTGVQDSGPLTTVYTPE